MKPFRNPQSAIRNLFLLLTVLSVALCEIHAADGSFSMLQTRRNSTTDVFVWSFLDNGDGTGTPYVKLSGGTTSEKGSSVTVSTSDVSAPASNTAAVITYAAGGAGVSHILHQLTFSYNATPTSGTIKIEAGSGNIVWGPHAVTSAGIGPVVFSPPKKIAANTALIITLSAGGSGVTGVLSATHSTE